MGLYYLREDVHEASTQGLIKKYPGRISEEFFDVDTL